jgi:hypothetical protein
MHGVWEELLDFSGVCIGAWRVVSTIILLHFRERASRPCRIHTLGGEHWLTETTLWLGAPHVPC